MAKKLGLSGFQILIPTKGRVGQQQTLRSLPPRLRGITTLVAPREEVPELERRYEDLGLQRILPQVPGLKHIAEKRAWMMKWARGKYERVVMIDDDCYFFARAPLHQRKWDEEKSYWVPAAPHYKLLSVEHATSDRLVSTFSELNQLIAECGHAGLSSRNGNHIVREEIVRVGRMMHCIGYDTEVFAAHVRTRGRPIVREDFDYTLQLLRAGYANAIVYHTCVSPGGYNAPGGCSDERTRELSNEQAHLLAAAHPGFVRIRNGVVRYRSKDTEFKNSNEESERLEVTVSWRKAYESAPEKRRPTCR